MKISILGDPVTKESTRISQPEKQGTFWGCGIWYDILQYDYTSCERGEVVYRDVVDVVDVLWFIGIW